jgi:tRNA U34 5-methylaminomethyl-2-thiouridine-forming methyltransferase MnmC
LIFVNIRNFSIEPLSHKYSVLISIDRYSKNTQFIKYFHYSFTKLSMPEPNRFLPQLTDDGSFTFFSAEFGETFHSQSGAIQEAEAKFVQPLQLKEQAKKPNLQLLDICYGLGYNTAAALKAIWQINPDCQIELFALELDPSVPAAAKAHELMDNWPQPIPQTLSQLVSEGQIQTQHLQATLLIGDARSTIQQLPPNWQADAIFLDPFSPPSCPQLWTVEFLGKVAKHLQPQGKLATYSCSAAVRSALLAAELKIGATIPVGRKSPGTIASFTPTDLPPLSPQEQEHLQTRAAIPYRDPNLSDPANVILHRRHLEQQISPLEPTSRWKKRWLMN